MRADDALFPDPGPSSETSRDIRTSRGGFVDSSLSPRSGGVAHAIASFFLQKETILALDWDVLLL